MSRRRQGGSAAIELAAGIAVLLLPVALLVATLPQWAARQGVARLAANDAARAVGLRGVCDPTLAEAIVDDVARDAGLGPDTLRVVLDCTPSMALGRDSAVTARVRVDMAALSIPVLGSVSGWSWTATHRAPMDPYASRS